MTPNMDQVWGIVRTVLTAVVAYVAGKGWIPANIVPAELVSAIVTILVTLWSILGKTQTATVAKAAAIVPIDPMLQRSVGIDQPVKPTP